MTNRPEIENINLKTKLIFKKHKGFTNIYVIDKNNHELGNININNNLYHSNSRTEYAAHELYEIADKMLGNPSREDLIEAHKQLLRRAEKLRKRVTELTERLYKLDSKR